jgi:hypothetical protein
MKLFTFLKEHEKISFNQALILLNGAIFTGEKYEDANFSEIFKPQKGKSERVDKIKLDGNIELFELERKQYFEQFKTYNLLVAKYDDNTPATPTIETQEFLKWAISKGFFIKSKPTNLKTVQKDKNREIIQLVLLDFLEQSTSGKKYKTSELINSPRFIKSLKDNEIIVTETGEDVNKGDRESNEMTPRTLGEHLVTIFKCSKSNWWTEQDKESIQDKVKKYH